MTGLMHMEDRVNVLQLTQRGLKGEIMGGKPHLLAANLSRSFDATTISGV